jgi:serpin B
MMDELRPSSALVLLNAVYFKGGWASVFGRSATRPRPFYSADDETLSVPMMQQTAQYRVVERDDFVTVALPYESDSLAMVIVLPKERNGLAAVAERLTVEAVRSTLEDLEREPPAETVLSLPKFEFEFGAQLIPALQACGMNLPFSPGAADFGGITGPDAAGLLWIDEIRHLALVEVDERGTEAAAATSARGILLSLGYIGDGTVRHILIDHPFLFFLVERPTGALLFMGHVKNPVAG